MSTQRAQRVLLERLGSSQTVLVPILLDLDASLPGADGVVHGQSVVLVGAHALRQLPEGEVAIQAVLAALGEGTVPEGVLPISYAPCVSAGMALVLAGAGVQEVMFDGPRQTGKTQAVAGLLLALAEGHVRAGHPLPLLALWLHASLVAASTKTIPSLQEPHWGGGWSMQEAGTVAVFTLGGIEYVRATYIPTEDLGGAERGRAATHVVVVEEAVAGLTESGISERAYDLARSSMLRLPTARRVAIVNTNPGSPESWPFRRFIEPGRPGCVRCPVPARDRLTPEEDAAQIASLSGSPDLERRLGRGEWCGLLLGQPVVPNWNPVAHVSPHPLVVVPHAETWMAWDSGGGAHCHATVIAQSVSRHELHILAALVSEDTGLAQHLEVVRAWVGRRMAWLGSGAGRDRLFHRWDPSMEPHDGGDAAFSGVRRVREAFGGHINQGKGSNEWGAMINPVLELLNRGNDRGGMLVQVDPGEDTRPLRRCLEGGAYYGLIQGGLVARDRQHKPNHPHEDVLDALCYLAQGLVPALARSALRVSSGRPPRPAKRDFDAFNPFGAQRSGGLGGFFGPKRSKLD
ncbi:MAG TPA: hypothetical protein VGQ73_04335 [Gemmatimonadales bacterium]|jgi:hypothetical protein|nr:hypothetical protein [Gemmatimonadales bacterium]